MIIPPPLTPAFRPAFPWWGADLQTLKNNIAPATIDLSRYPAQRLHFKPDDGSGDTLIGTLHHLPESAANPLILLLHGLGGDANSFYMRDMASTFLNAGFSVLRLNLRGAGPSAQLCRQHYFAGRSHDLRLIIPQLPANLTASGIIPIGVSLGGNLTLKFMGEGAAVGIRGAASISAPLDLAACARAFMKPRNAFYQRYILQQLRREVAASPATLAPLVKHQAMAAKTLWAFDDAYTAPRNGYKDAADFYAKCSSNQFLPRIPLPTLLIHAADDPWVPRRAYDDIAWHGNPNLRLVMPAGGGHVGFHGAGGTWYPKVLLEFVQQVAAR